MRRLSKFAALAALAFVFAATPALAESAGHYIDDATLTTKVKASLVSDSVLKDTTDISVKTTGGTVQLSGTVASKPQEDEAVKVAQQTAGVRSVQDLLVIK